VLCLIPDLLQSAMLHLRVSRSSSCKLTICPAPTTPSLLTSAAIEALTLKARRLIIADLSNCLEIISVFFLWEILCNRNDGNLGTNWDSITLALAYMHGCALRRVRLCVRDQLKSPSNNDFSTIAMEDELTPRGVIDPEVRAYVYSLVSAVRTIILCCRHNGTKLTSSLVEPAPTKMADTYWETMHLRV